MLTIKPAAFIVCSTEQLEVARTVQEEIEFEVEATIWHQSSEAALGHVIDGLIKDFSRIDFGIVIYAPDDTVRKRGIDSLAPRDNVILELGMLLGRLGKERCFVLPRDALTSGRQPICSV
jgi:predicted nucleotide-binding protein